MSKLPKIKPLPTTQNTMIVCWDKNATEEDKAHDLKELEKYMEFRKKRALATPVEPKRKKP